MAGRSRGRRWEREKIEIVQIWKPQHLFGCRHRPRTDEQQTKGSVFILSSLFCRLCRTADGAHSISHKSGTIVICVTFTNYYSIQKTRNRKMKTLKHFRCFGSFRWICSSHVVIDAVSISQFFRFDLFLMRVVDISAIQTNTNTDTTQTRRRRIRCGGSVSFQLIWIRRCAHENSISDR